MKALSRQRLWQLRRKQLGLCPQCGHPVSPPLVSCLACGVKRRERKRRWMGCVKINNSITRRMEAAENP